MLNGAALNELAINFAQRRVIIYLAAEAVTVTPQLAAASLIIKPT